MSLARAAFVAASVLYAGLLVAAYLLYPDRVPVHWDGGLAPDDFASRTSAVLFLAVVGGAMAVLFTGLVHGVGRIPVSLVNVPHKDWWSATPERLAELRRRIADDTAVLGALTMVFLDVLLVATVVAARSDDQRLGAGPVVALVVYVVAMLAYCVYLPLRRYRPDEG